jgi:hypothetical protein
MVARLKVALNLKEKAVPEIETAFQRETKNGYLGIETWSVTWITPFEPFRSATITVALSPFATVRTTLPSTTEAFRCFKVFMGFRFSILISNWFIWMKKLIELMLISTDIEELNRVSRQQNFVYGVYQEKQERLEEQ